jgi:hypothetical protein
MKRLQSALLIAALAVLCIAPVSAAPLCTKYTDFKPLPTGTKVAQICYNARPVPGIRTLVTPPNGAPDSREVKQDWMVPPGTSIAVPDATYIDLVDSRAAFRSSPGMRVTVAQKGYELTGAGRVQFAVVRAVDNALDFFGVKVGRFIAAVPGTVFRVDLTDPDFVTFSVAEGRVAVTREVSVHLERENRNVDGVLLARYITPADPPLTYGRAAERYGSFPDVNAARATFTKDVEFAKRVADPVLIVATRRNLDVLNASGPKRHSSVLPYLGAAAAAAALGVILSNKGATSPSPSPSPRSHGAYGDYASPTRPRATPTPTPTPTPGLR